MGLDVIVIKNPKPVKANKGDGRSVYNMPEFQERNTLFPDGSYQGECIDHINIGYSTYNRFREKIAEIIGVRLDLLWEHPQAYKTMPFYELLDFADNEGSIDYVVAGRIAKAFIEYEKQALAHLTDTYFHNKYLEFKEAFCLAAENKGIVIYG